MTNNIGCIGIGRQFEICGKRYVRIPEMILQCGGAGFVVNTMYVVKSDPYMEQKIIAEFMHPDMIVTLIE